MLIMVVGEQMERFRQYRLVAVGTAAVLGHRPAAGRQPARPSGSPQRLSSAGRP